MKPHKHAELIKAWADGAEIQAKLAEGYGTGEWYDTDIPTWGLDKEYRIKPEQKPDVVGYCYLHTGGVTEGFYVFADRSINSNLKLTFDGKTGELKSAEVLK